MSEIISADRLLSGMGIGGRLFRRVDQLTDPVSTLAPIAVRIQKAIVLVLDQIGVTFYLAGNDGKPAVHGFDDTEG